MPKKNGSEIKHFETAFEKLKSIVAQLENGKLTLSESLERYEEGIGNLKDCYEALNQAQLKIEQLVKLDENGRLVTRPFDDAASFDPSRLGQSGAAESSCRERSKPVKPVTSGGKKKPASKAAKLPLEELSDENVVQSADRITMDLHLEAERIDKLDAEAGLEDREDELDDFDNQNSLF